MPSVDPSDRVTALLQAGVLSATPSGAAITGERWRLRLADGHEVFVKTRPGAPDGFFATEAAGLDWLGSAEGGPPLPATLAYDTDLLVLPWLTEERPRDGAVDRLGLELAALHAAGSPVFGAEQDGWIGAAELENGPLDGWPEFYAARRVLPYVRQLRDAGRLTAGETAVFERLAARLPALAGPAEPPARIHGDLWSGNVLWSGGRGWLVDPAAHGGHRETDLAMLALFGCPHLDEVLAAYDDAAPLAPGWRDRVALHQLFPLLVHVVLFGRGYAGQAVAAARAALRQA
jgi:fructosamine-3-kinase